MRPAIHKETLAKLETSLTVRIVRIVGNLNLRFKRILDQVPLNGCEFTRMRRRASFSGVDRAKRCR
jgi:hypothetical protein